MKKFQHGYDFLGITEMAKHFNVKRNVIKNVIQYRKIKRHGSLYRTSEVEGFIWKKTRPELININKAAVQWGFPNKHNLLVKVMSSKCCVKIDGSGNVFLRINDRNKIINT